MGIPDLPQVEPQGYRALDEYVRYLANNQAIQRDELINILEGRLSTVNIREIAGWLVSMYELKSKDGDVGFSTEDTGGDDIRIYAGDAKDGNPSFVVRKSGKVDISSSGTYPKVVFSSQGELIGVYMDADKYISLIPVKSGSPALIIHDVTPKLYLQHVLNTILFRVFDARLKIEAEDEIEFSTPSSDKKIKVPSWDRIQSQSPLRTLQQDLNEKANAFTGYHGSVIVQTGPAPTYAQLIFNNGVLTNVIT